MAANNSRVMSKRELFVEAACAEHVEQFLHFILLHKDKAEPFDVEEVVQEMPRDQREALWGRLDSLLQHFLQELPPERWEEAREEAGGEGESAVDPKHVVAVVDGVALVASASLKVLQDGDTYKALLKVAHKLHTVLVSLPFSDTPLQLHIYTLCVAWWKKGLKEREQFGHTAFLISLQKSLIVKKPGVEIQRLWSLHDVLLSLDYTSEDNKQIVDLLLQCLQRPVYLRNDDGKRLLVFLFSWNVDFISFIHGTIKNQLEFFNKPVITHITEIYFRAWKKATGDFLEQIEICIQDYMQRAILLHRASPLHAKVRQIVNYFHSRKGCNKVDTMLHNLYKPILWTALNAPNFEVRASATLLFAEAFPVHNPDQTNEHIDDAIQSQLYKIMALLKDPHPVVRSSAILGVCKILAKCWELLPPTIITEFVKKLVKELSMDGSSPDVRCSVFQSLNLILDNHLSHPLLEKLLPSVKYSLHDNSEKVRIAFLEMLLKVKAVRAAKFWEVSSMDHLLARLAMDSESVSKRIVDLLFKSFFPVDETDREWCCRCITLIQMNPMAARKFYQHTYRYTAPATIIKMMLAIRRVLNSSIQSDFDVTEIDDSIKENSQQAAPVLGKDMAVVSGLLEVVVILWRSVKPSLKTKRPRSTRLLSLEMSCPNISRPLSCSVLSRLKKLEPGAVPAQYSQLLDCMCSWGQAAAILELVSEWLTEALPKQREKANASRKVHIQETVEAKPDLALVYLEYLFSSTSTREEVMALGQIPLNQLLTVLGNWKSVLHTHLSSTADDQPKPSLETALKAFLLHGRLGAHLQHNASEGRDYLLSLQHTAAWVAERVLPFLTNSANSDEEKSQPLAAEITENFLAVCRDVLLVGLGDEEFKGQILHLCSLVLLSEAGFLCIPAVLPILKEVAASYVPEDNKQDQENQEDPTTVILGVVANIFQKVIELLARRLRKEPEEGKQLCQSAKPGLTDFLQVAQTWDTAPLIGVFSTVLALIIVETRHFMHKITLPEEVITPESVEDMPPLSSVLLSVVLKSSDVSRAFLTEVCSSLESEAISSLYELAAVLHVLSVIKQTNQSKAGLKRAATALQQHLQKHAVRTSDPKDIQRIIFESSVKTINEILDQV